MRPILLYWISKKILLLVDYLRPFFGFFIPKNPPFIVFSLYYKQTIYRNNKMVDLACISFFIFYKNVIYRYIFIYIKFLKPIGYIFLSEPTFYFCCIKSKKNY